MISPQLKSASDHTILVSFGDTISFAHHQSVVRLTTLLLTERPAFIRNIHPAYCSLLVSFDVRMASFSEVESYLTSTLQKLDSVPLPPSRTVEIPVCYGDEFGPDLADVAAHNRITIDEVLRVHSSGEYLVYFLGFSPGFPFIGGMSEKIATPRLAAPRTKVPAGSVAIGGKQTGIYPVSSPGGWRLIGRTPLRLFDPASDPVTLLQMGDVVRFKPIAREEYARMHLT
ncbi:MAG TPA: 5-oxoprolinase subunit PxpB [Bacteroidota bacterium]